MKKQIALIISLISITAYAGNHFEFEDTLDITGNERVPTVIARPYGLVWKRCYEGQVWDKTSKVCTGSPTRYSVGGAIRYLSQQRHDNPYSWKLPNIKELSTLIDRRYPHSIDILFSDPSAPSYTGFEEVQVLSSTFLRGLEPQPPDYVLRNPVWHVQFPSGHVQPLMVHWGETKFVIRLVRLYREQQSRYF